MKSNPRGGGCVGSIGSSAGSDDDIGIRLSLGRSMNERIDRTEIVSHVLRLGLLNICSLGDGARSAKSCGASFIVHSRLVVKETGHLLEASVHRAQRVNAGQRRQSHHDEQSG